MSGTPRADGTVSVAGLQLQAGTVKESAAPAPATPRVIERRHWACSECNYISPQSAERVQEHIDAHHKP